MINVPSGEKLRTLAIPYTEPPMESTTYKFASVCKSALALLRALRIRIT